MFEHELQGQVADGEPVSLDYKVFKTDFLSNQNDQRAKNITNKNALPVLQAANQKK